MIEHELILLTAGTCLDLFGEDFCAPMTDAVESGLRKLESQWESSEQRFRERVQYGCPTLSPSQELLG